MVTDMRSIRLRSSKNAGLVTMKKIIRDPRWVLIAAPLILLSPVYLTGKALFWGTPATQFIPWWEFGWNSIMSGQLPFWNPLVGMGAPLAANYQSAFFYPPTWIYFAVYLLGGVKWMAWSASLLVCSHLILSGIGTAFVLRELKVSEFGQAVGGLAFSLSGYLIARAGFLSINAAAAWLPWTLLYLYRLSAGKKGAGIKLVLVIAMLLLAGHAQTAWITILMGIVWGIFWALQNGDKGQRLKNLRKSITGYLLSGFAGLAISAVQLLPTLEYLLNSQRADEYGYQTAMTYSFWPWRFLTLILPDMFGNPAVNSYWGYGNFWEDAVYIGLLPFIIAFFFILKEIRKRIGARLINDEIRKSNLVMLLTAVILLSFVLALGDNTVIYPFLYRNVPGINLFQAPTRYSLMAVFSMSLLAGIGISKLEKPSGKKLYITRLVLAGSLSLTLGAILTWLFLEGIKPSFIISVGKVGMLGFASALLFLFMPEERGNEKARKWNFLAVCLISVDLIIAGWGLNPGVEATFYEVIPAETSLGRIWMPADLEYDLKFNKYLRFDTFKSDVNWNEMHKDYLPNLPMMQNVQMVNNFDPVVPNSYQSWMEEINRRGPDKKILEMMNVGSVVELTGENEIRLVPTGVANGEVKLAGCAQVINSEEISPELILDASRDLGADIIVTSDEAVPCAPASSGSIKILERKNGYLKIALDLDGDSWIFWSQTWYPGWKFRIDGKEEERIYPVNYLFQGAPAHKNANQIEFIYRPESIFCGGLISALGLIITAGASIWAHKGWGQSQGSD